MSVHLFKLQRYLTHVDQCLRYPLAVGKWHQIHVNIETRNSLN